MSSSGLDWRPVLEAWLKTRSQKEVSVFQQLFEESFATMYTWGTQNLCLTMKVLQCNIVQQVGELQLTPSSPDSIGPAMSRSRQ
jgi:dynein heavy chain